MIGRLFLSSIATAVAVISVALTGFADLARAVTTLKNGDVDGFIRASSPALQFRNESRRGTPIQKAAGDEYSFSAQPGDKLNFVVEIEDGSNLSPVLVLIYSQTGEQVAYDDSSNSLQYQVPAAGEYKLLVLGQNSTRGRYTLSASGLSEGAPVSQADQKRKQILQDEYGLRALDNCPESKNSLVVVSFPESTQTHTYCANPNRAVRAGEYTYNTSTGDLDPAKKPKQCAVVVGGACVVK
jgi:hypothetical protein